MIWTFAQVVIVTMTAFTEILPPDVSGSPDFIPRPHPNRGNSKGRDEQTRALVSLVIPASDPLVSGPSRCWPIGPGSHSELDELCACSSKPNSEKKSASLRGQVENPVSYEWLVGFSLTFLSVSGHLCWSLPKADLLQCKMFVFYQSSLKPSAVAFFSFSFLKHLTNISSSPPLLRAPFGGGV